MIRLHPLRHPGLRYRISADELHARVIADLKSYCEHQGLAPAMFARIFTDNSGESGRPLEQTIRLVINAFRYRET